MVVEQDVLTDASTAVEWLSARQASLRFAVSERRIREAGSVGYLDTLEPLPGMRRGFRRYSASSVEALARGMVRPATRSPSPTLEEPSR